MSRIQHDSQMNKCKARPKMLARDNRYMQFVQGISGKEKKVSRMDTSLM